MAELALYRKYRPRTFSEMIGQEHVTTPLSQALRSDRLHHAYLFSGPRGCGKTSSARILARSLNCAKGPTPDPCGECDSCRALAPDGAGSIDVIEIDAASHGGVDDARDLRERAFFAPVSSRYKVYVIDEAHMVSSAGFNALLKLVEEPPEYVKFVFATTEPEKVLGTIKSRTHHYPFRLVPPAVLRPYLEKLAAAEKVRVEPPVFPLVVRAGAGSVRDSLSVLDQLMAGAGPEGITYARAVALLGVTDAALIDEVVDALAVGDGRAVFTTIDRVADAGHDARRFAGDLLERLRDLIVLQHIPDAVGKGLLDGAEDELARMTDQSQRFGAATLSRMADIVHTGLIDMRGTTAPRLVLELIAARMLLPASDDATSSVLARVERLERRLTLAGGDTPATAASESEPPGSVGVSTARSRPTEVVPPPAAPAAVPAVSAPAPAVSPPVSPTMESVAPAVDPVVPEAAPHSEPTGAGPGAIDAAAVRRIWDEVLTMVRRKSPRAAAVVREATVREVDGDVMILVFKHSFHAEAVSASPDLLLDALYEVLGGRWKIRCEIAGQPGGGPVIGGSNRSTPATPVQPTPPQAAPASVDESARTSVPPAQPSEVRSPQVPSPVGESRSDATAPLPSRPAPTAISRPSDADCVDRSQPDSDSTRPDSTGAGSGSTGSGSTGSGSTGSGSTGSGSTGSGSTGSGPMGPGSTSSGATSPGPTRSSSSRSGSTGSAGPSSGPAVAMPVTVEVEEDWPTPATLGGAGVDGGVAPGSASEPSRPVPAARRSAHERAAANAATAPAKTEPAVTTPTKPAAKPTASARAAANATAQKSGARPGAPRPAGRDDVWAGSNADEPPWDPEFDPATPGSDGHVGFDPGDEPADDESTTGRSTEQAALDLLRDTLGAERIGGSDRA